MHYLENFLNKIPFPRLIEILFQESPFLRRSYYGLLERIFKKTEHNGMEVMEEDWDILIVLDACRYDYFKKLNEIPGKLEKRTSLGSDTGNWKEKNFQKKYPDTVYVTANPQLSKVKLKKDLGFVPFHHVEEVWDYGWDDEWDTVQPKEVVKAAIKVRKRFPDKRMVVHFDQPHMPFIAESYAEELKEKRRSLDQDELWARIIKGKNLNTARDIWRFVSKGMISREKAVKGYIDNLEYVLDEVESLIEKLEGKIVVTADHGDAHGEYWIYGHPGYVYLSPLVEVPWLEIENKKNRRYD